jgi:hypothetical protein
MYEVVSVGKLSETQKSKLRNGHPVRVKSGSGNKLCLSQEQIKKLSSAARKGKAVTITLHPEQAAKHGSGMFGDIATKLKKLAVQNKDIINPIIGSVRSGAKKGIAKLSSAANQGIDKYIQNIEGEGIKRRRGRPKGKGILGNVLKGLIDTTGLGVVTPPLLSVKTRKPRKTKKKGEGIGMIAKLAAKALAPIAIDAVSNFAKNKVSGMGAKKRGSKKKKAKKRGRKKRAGGALMPAGY